MKLIFTVLVVCIGVLLNSQTSWALPKCSEISGGSWHKCFGSLTLPKGDKFVGIWEDDDYKLGTYTWGPNTSTAGNKFYGEFRNGKRNGYGTVIFPNGGVVVGRYKNDKMNLGHSNYHNGDKYWGEYKKGVRHGIGIYLRTSGETNEGTWEDGTFVEEGSFPDGLRKKIDFIVRQVKIIKAKILLNEGLISEENYIQIKKQVLGLN